MASILPEDIANMALGLLTEAPIDSLDEDTKPARLINLHYETTREAELTKYAWNFAILTEEVEPTDTEVGTLRYAYELPADCLRVLPPSYDGEPVGGQANWRQEGSLIYSDSGNIPFIRYVGNLTDPGDWDALFTDVFVAALAVKVAHALTGKASMIQVAQQAYDRALSQALRANAMTRAGRASSGSWAQARGDYRAHGGYWR